MPNGTIGHAEVRIGDSLIMISEAQGEEYKPMPAGRRCRSSYSVKQVYCET